MPAAEMQSFRATTPDLLRGERGWMSQIKTAAPGGGRKMFLTSPFIDQAFALRTGSSVIWRFFANHQNFRNSAIRMLHMRWVPLYVLAALVTGLHNFYGLMEIVNGAPINLLNCISLLGSATLV